MRPIILIKVPLVLIENFVFTFFPFLRPLVERYIFNPLDFKSDHAAYTQKKFAEFQTAIDEYSDLHEKVILELGPGGSLGFGLLALEDGARKYLALDDGIHTFVGKTRLLQYKKLLPSSQSLKKYFTRDKNRVSYNSHLLEYVIIDQKSKYPLKDDSIDIIYSCAVLEHIHDLDLCFSEMSRVLKNGGIMYHEVDLRDHIFSQKSLWFLTISDFWFHLLFSHTGGYVNRKRLSYYRYLAVKHHLEILSIAIPVRYEQAPLTQKLRTIHTDDDLQALSLSITLRKSNV